MIINCREFAIHRLNNIKNKIDKLTTSPQLLVITNKNIESQKYLRGLQKDCCIVGADLIISDDVNAFKYIEHDGIIIQRPCNFREANIHYKKDIDTFNPNNLYLNATSQGILFLLDDMRMILNNKTVVMVGRSKCLENLYNYLLQQGATVIMCSKDTHGLFEYTSRADVLIVATSTANLIDNPKLIQSDAVVIDVGNNCNTEALSPFCNITSTINGIGLMTRAALLENLLLAIDLSNVGCQSDKGD